jgi:probable rRNA maturation factor
VHGVLHLLGYDHADPEEEAEMFGLQNELLADWRRESSGRAPSAPAPSAPADDKASDDKASGPPASGEGPEGPALCPPPSGCWSSPSC